MSYELNLKTATAPAGASLATSQYLFGVLNSGGQIIVNTVLGGRVAGVIQDNQATTGSAARYGYAGVSKVKCGGTFAIGDAITSDGAGKAIKATTGYTIRGFATEAGVDGQIAAINLTPAGAVGP